MSLKRVLSVVLLVAMAGALGALTARAEPFNQGEAKCDNCHKAEDAVWKKTKHATSFREVHRKPAVKGITIVCTQQKAILLQLMAPT